MSQQGWDHFKMQKRLTEEHHCQNRTHSSTPFFPSHGSITSPLQLSNCLGNRPTLFSYKSYSKTSKMQLDAKIPNCILSRMNREYIARKKKNHCLTINRRIFKRKLCILSASFFFLWTQNPSVVFIEIVHQTNSTIGKTWILVESSASSSNQVAAFIILKEKKRITGTPRTPRWRILIYCTGCRRWMFDKLQHENVLNCLNHTRLAISCESCFNTMNLSGIYGKWCIYTEKWAHRV